MRYRTDTTPPQAPRVVALAEHPAALPVVAGWLHDEWWGAWGLSLAQAQAGLRARMQHRALPLALLALAGDLPVGTASLVHDEHPLDAGTICSLADVYVAPAWRQRGVGRLLCSRAVELAQTLQPHPTGLYTRDTEAFYRHLGWTKLLDTPVRHPVAPTLGAYMEWHPQ